MQLTHRIAPGLVGGALLLSSVSGAFAAQAPTTPVRLVVVAGQVSGLPAASASGFTLTWTPKKAGAAPKTWQILTTPTTREVPVRGTTGALQNGEYALVVGTSATAGVTARSIRYSVTPFTARQVAIVRLRVRLAVLTAARAHTVRGTLNLLQSTSSNLSVTVTTKAGTKIVMFAITPATKFRIGTAAATATAPVFTNGEKVVVRYKRDAATKALDALVVRVPAATS